MMLFMILMISLFLLFLLFLLLFLLFLLLLLFLHLLLLPPNIIKHVLFPTRPNDKNLRARRPHRLLHPTGIAHVAVLLAGARPAHLAAKRSLRFGAVFGALMGREAAEGR